MDEDLAIINESTRKEKLKIFLVNYKKRIYFFVGLILLLIFTTFLYLENIKKRKNEIADKFVKASVNFDIQRKTYYIDQFNQIINTHDSTYAPLALFFLVDNKILKSNEKINDLFDIVINKVDLEKEMKNLVIYKKALINADFISENEIIKILKPLVNSESFWKPHALLLLGDYFLFKGEKQKAKDFYIQITSIKNISKNILNQTQQRIRKNYVE